MRPAAKRHDQTIARGLDEPLRPDRKAAQPFSGGVARGVCHRRIPAGDSNLVYTLNAVCIPALIAC